MRNDSCNLYFHPRPFVKNNIKYRIAAGSSIAKYKHSQAFLLSELAFNPFHEFSVEAKEILLLKYDVWFDFLCEVEQFLLVMESDTTDQATIKNVINMSDERVEYYKETLTSNDSIFSKEYTSLWLEVHEMSYRLLVSDINDMTGLTHAEFFASMTSKLINTMNHTLYELQEIDILLFTKKDFEFNLDSVCCTYFGKFGESLIGNKLKMFEKVRKSEKISIKKYADVDVPWELTPLKKYLDDRKIIYKVI